MNPNDTIFAPASAPGRSGVAVIRISGAKAASCFVAFDVTPPAPRMAALRTLKHPETGSVLDESLLLYFPAPNSFTGEEVVEIHAHGGKAVVEGLIDALTVMPDFRIAAPGEFTRRAVEHGKMDIMQAEGLADVIDAQTQEQRSLAMMQMGGYPSKKYHEMREKAIHALALLEAYIDFPDEPVPESVLTEVREDIASLKMLIDQLIQDHKRGQLIRDGVEIAIIGAPNAGKSSLINYLAGRDVAIVSDIAGTTRDTLEVSLNIKGMLVHLVDTAGIRDSEDAIEAEGVRRALLRAEEADGIIHVIDGSSSDASEQAIEEYKKPSITLSNKSDLKSLKTEATSLPISLKTEEGLDHMMVRLEQMVSDLTEIQGDPPIITRQRHKEALEKANTALESFPHQDELELMCEELRIASDAIAAVTGAISTDDLLDVIFSSFCIGK